MSHIVFNAFDVDLVVIIIVYLLVYYSETGAGIFAFVQGLLIDIFSGGMFGLFTLLYLIIFLLIKLASRPLDLLSTLGQVVVISMAILLKEALMVIILYMFSFATNFLIHNILLTVFSAIFSGLIAPFLFYILNKLGLLFIGLEMENKKDY